ncbi:MAG: biotin/lipoyl-binding protein, partial [Candidatus Dormibacteraeota bacterium]|nr:biotin/lipoyl-binding protein [Candidatus Dormibacteraeota bacterium]
MLAQPQPELEVIRGPFFRRDRVVAAVLAIVAILLGVLIVRDLVPAAPTSSINTTAVRTGTVQAAVQGTGTLQPVQQENVNFRVSGTLTEVDAQVGQQVTAGQVLAKVDPTTYQTAANQAQLQLNAAQQQLSATQAGTSLVSAQHKLAQDQANYNLQVGADQSTLAGDQSTYNTDGCLNNPPPSVTKCLQDQAKIDS